VIEMEIRGVDFSVLDALQEVLNSSEEVEYAGASLTHPLLGTIRFVLRTKSGYKAEDALRKGLAELARRSAELKESLSVLLGR